MELLIQQGDIAATEADCVIVNLFEDVNHPGGATGFVDRALNGAITSAIAAGDFKGEADTTLLLYTNGAIAAPRVIVTGLGKAEDFDFLAARKAAAAGLAKAAGLKGVRAVATICHGTGIGGRDTEEMAKALALGSLLAAYKVRKYPADDREQGVSTCTLVEYHAEQIPAMQAGLDAGRALADGVCFTRDLVNEPPNLLYPAEMADRVRAAAADTALKCEVLGEETMRELGMGMILGVSRGSRREAQLIILRHEPEGLEAQQPLIFLGKGITFDTGGISLKPSSGMEEMKTDMGGAGAVCGAMLAISALNIPRRVFGLAICVENMPDGDAYRPGDILTGISGKTAEIINTDAEGRLVLADCLGYVKRFSPSAVVDLATLTGAIGIALGSQAAGLFANDDALQAAIVAAAAATGDRVWPMPMYDEYKEDIKSDMAEVKNAGSRMGGVSSSAKFLEHFTEDYPWAHLDIAYMALQGKGKPGQPKGASGYGVQLLASLAAAI
ncbi:MAG: leucyl aminopeptidase [Caldilineaceae bacterium]|nr:leucyl aminopeptidase [Caldilineaceae bacterium]